MAAVFELYGENGELRMSSTYPTFQYVSKEQVPSLGSGIVTSNNINEWDQMKLAAHLYDTDNKWYRYIYDEAGSLPAPPDGEPALVLYDDTGDKVTFVLKYPVMSIKSKHFLGEPEYVTSEDYRTAKILMNGRKIALSRIAMSGPVIYTWIGSYTYHNQRYDNYRVTSYWIEPVYDYTNGWITFRLANDSYISEGHTTPPQNVDNYLTLHVLAVDVTGL